MSEFEILSTGTYKGERARVIAMRDEYSADMCPDGDGYVPQFYADYRRGFELCHGVNLENLPSHLDADRVLNGVLEIRDAFYRNHRLTWAEIAERWLRIVGCVNASVREVSLDQGSWGLMIAVVSNEWLQITGCDRDYQIYDEDTLDFENWLRGDVSYIELQTVTHDCNCDYCETEWISVERVHGIYGNPWEIDREDALSRLPLDE